MDTGSPPGKQAFVQRASVCLERRGTVSGLSVAAYFPWSRVKVVSQSVVSENASALIRLEPDRRYWPLCHACGGRARTVHSPTRKFVHDLDFGGHTMLLQVEHRKIWCDTCGG